MKRLMKSIVRRLPTRLTDPLLSYRQRKFIDRIQRRQGLPQIFDACAKRYGLQIMDGPFKGMNYVSRAMGSTGTPKLLGSYECELHPWLARLLQKSYTQIIDVGCAEGYYAVGLAMRLPGAQVIAYDIDPLSQRLCREMAAANAVADRVRVLGRCTIPGLKDTLHDRALLICDCEGFEQDLLNPQTIPALLTTDMLIELHDFFRPGLTQTLSQRFAKSHTIELTDATERNPANYPSVAFLPPHQQPLALTEGRNGPQQWALMMAKATGDKKTK
jgi:hypothetical protein